MMASILKVIGWIVPPAIWAATTQLGQILPYPDCHAGMHLTATVTILGALASLASVVAPRLALSGMERRTGRFVRDLGCLVGLAFCFALLLQGAATALLNACAR